MNLPYSKVLTIKHPILVLSLFSFFLLTCHRITPSDRLLEFQGETMGTYYSVKVVRQKNLKKSSPPDALQSGIDYRLRKLNNQMSTYLPESELSRFNTFRDTTWFPVSPALFKVMKEAIRISRLSEGAFDMTVGPLVNLWGFGPTTREDHIPPEDQIQQALKLVGYEKILLKANPPRVKKQMVKMYCDLSGIAKGYGVDLVADYLDSLGFTNYLVEIGGEIRTKGRSQLGQFWRVGISTPDNQFGLQKILSLQNTAIATSGDYRNYFEKNGKRYSHTIDPKTGRPVTHKLASVSVIQVSCMVADALATAIDVMGPHLGLKFAEDQKLPVFLIVKTNQGFTEKMTVKFKSFITQTEKGK